MNYAEFKQAWKFDAAVFGARLKPYQHEDARNVVGCCYFVVNVDGMLAYVGQTSTGKLGTRIKSHSEKRWFSKAYFIETDESNVKTRAAFLEQALIRLFQPYANRERYKNKGSFEEDIWIVRQFGIQHPDDWLLGEIQAPKFSPYLLAVPRPQKDDKPGDYIKRMLAYQTEFQSLRGVAA